MVKIRNLQCAYLIPINRLYISFRLYESFYRKTKFSAQSLVYNNTKKCVLSINLYICYDRRNWKKVNRRAILRRSRYVSRSLYYSCSWRFNLSFSRPFPIRVLIILTILLQTFLQVCSFLKAWQFAKKRLKQITKNIAC